MVVRHLFPIKSICGLGITEEQRNQLVDPSGRGLLVVLILKGGRSPLRMCHKVSAAWSYELTQFCFFHWTIVLHLQGRTECLHPCRLVGKDREPWMWRTETGRAWSNGRKAVTRDPHGPSRMGPTAQSSKTVGGVLNNQPWHRGTSQEDTLL